MLDKYHCDLSLYIYFISVSSLSLYLFLYALTIPASSVRLSAEDRDPGLALGPDGLSAQSRDDKLWQGTQFCRFVSIFYVIISFHLYVVIPLEQCHSTFFSRLYIYRIPIAVAEFSRKEAERRWEW